MKSKNLIYSTEDQKVDILPVEESLETKTSLHKLPSGGG